MTVRVGELTSQVEMQGPGVTEGHGPDAGMAAALQPTFQERERYRHLAEDDRRDRERVAGGGFDG
ncbi:MAG: hypothetical protein ACRDZO_27125 [Egibacteraceae bacterium]